MQATHTFNVLYTHYLHAPVARAGTRLQPNAHGWHHTTSSCCWHSCRRHGLVSQLIQALLQLNLPLHRSVEGICLGQLLALQWMQVQAFERVCVVCFCTATKNNTYLFLIKLLLIAALALGVLAALLGGNIVADGFVVYLREAAMFVPKAKPPNTKYRVYESSSTVQFLARWVQYAWLVSPYRCVAFCNDLFKTSFWVDIYHHCPLCLCNPHKSLQVFARVFRFRQQVLVTIK